MRKQLFPTNAKRFKANLHMHTTISDGQFTPEDTKRIYKEHGYSIIAFTDHEVIVPHKELNDDGFLSITSFEKNYNETDMEFIHRKVIHLNFYAMDEDNLICPAFDEGEIWLEHSKAYVTPTMRGCQSKNVRTTPAGLNEVIAKANEAGFLVSYNHPVWSLNSYEDYIHLKGLWSVEWFNTGCFISGFRDTEQPITDLLNAGEMVFPTATDDTHNPNDLFGGWDIVMAEHLTYKEVMEALRKGDFYSSTGPTIDDLYYEDGVMVVKSPEAALIEMISDRRYTWKGKGDEARFDMTGYINDCLHFGYDRAYVRVIVHDDCGHKALTRAFSLKELRK